MSTLILVRHGCTAWNGERFLGRIDVPLDATGRQQAEELVASLDGVNVDVILTSPLQRACDTARPLARARGLVAPRIDKLAELDCGSLQGKLKADHGKLSKRDPAVPFPDGESLADAHRRAVVVAAVIEAQLRAQRDVLVVGHFVINQMLLGVLRGDGPADALRRLDFRPAPGVPYAWSPQEGLRRVAERRELVA